MIFCFQLGVSFKSPRRIRETRLEGFDVGVRPARGVGIVVSTGTGTDGPGAGACGVEVAIRAFPRSTLELTKK
jgi:hypothetical protein